MSANISHNPDVDHLRLLSIFQYIMAGLSALASCCSLGYVGFGAAILAGAFDNDANPPPPEIGLFFVVLFGGLTLYVWLWVLLELMAARCLSNHSWYRFCYVWAILELLNLPLGTILGVFELVVLSRPSVQALFAGVPYRDPRLAAFDEMDEDEEGESLPPGSSGENNAGSIREGDPTP